MRKFTRRILPMLLAVTIILGAGIKTAKANEGMWLFMFLKRNYEEMKQMGLKLSAEELYDINNSSLKDAIVSIGFFCTGEIISPNGLMLTNHHCAYGSIQEHSTTDHNYLDDGFWAMSHAEELPADGITASILVRMDDVTERVLAKAEEAGDAGKAGAIRKEMAAIEEEVTEGTHYDAKVKSMFAGNQYFVFVYETFKDVRLVGAPPSSIGKYGGDTDNWMWPRHTGDFSLYRIYMGQDGKPAAYSKDNVPYQPKHFLPISMEGVDEGDFAMVMGYPGRTQRYRTSFGIEKDKEQSNPRRIKLRTKKLELMKEDMDADEAVRIQYSAKYSQIANYWKYFIGQNEGLERLGTIQKKKAQEKEFMKWVNADADRKAKYGDALATIEADYKASKELDHYFDYMVEGAIGSEILSYAWGFNRLEGVLSAEKVDNDAVAKITSTIEAGWEEHFKNYNKATDKKLFAAMMKMFYNDVPAAMHPASLTELHKKSRGDWNKAADRVFMKSWMDDKDAVAGFLAAPTLSALQKDPAYELIKEFIGKYRMLAQTKAATDVQGATKLYLAGMMEMHDDKFFYPNANSTPRLSYGKVMDYNPRDAVQYMHYTTIDGIIEKANPNDAEFAVPERLVELYEKKDYGQYAENGQLFTCFITDNDITGGNSGSPVINGKGHLIGTAFDGNWEAMTGDLVYDPEFKRCINVDIRYTLWVIDKFAGASHLIDEMVLVTGDEDKASN